MRRALWETLVDVVNVASPAAGANSLLRVTSVALDLPIQIRVQETVNGLEFFADVPRWRWWTEFDEKPGRLQVLCTKDVA